MMAVLMALGLCAEGLHCKCCGESCGASSACACSYEAEPPLYRDDRERARTAAEPHVHPWYFERTSFYTARARSAGLSGRGVD